MSNDKIFTELEKERLAEKGVSCFDIPFSGNYKYLPCCGLFDGFNPIEYLIASEIENPWAFYAEDARDYALEGMIDGYMPRCKLAKMMLAFPRPLPIELKGIAV